MADTQDNKVDEVQIEGHVILKIIRHCESAHSEVSGILLGLDMDTTLEVTACFGLPQSDENTMEGYEFEMMRHLRDVNSDYLMVGWYRSSSMATFLDDETIRWQCEQQEALEKAVCVVYDPSLSTQGNLCIKAIRFTDLFMKYLAQRRFTRNVARQSGLKVEDMYHEIPIRIHNSALVSAALRQMSPLASAHGNVLYDSLSFSSEALMERTLQELVDRVDSLTTEQRNYEKLVSRQKSQQEQFLQKRSEMPGKDEDGDLSQNPLFRQIDEPSHLDRMIASRMIQDQCAQLHGLAGQGLSRVFMIHGLAK